MKKVLINIAILLGLIALVLAVNSTPMILIGYQTQLSTGLRWLATLVYIVLVLLLIIWLWRWYQKKVPVEIKEQKMTWKDIGVIVLFYLAGRAIVIIGSLANQMLSGNAMSVNDQAIFGISGMMKNGFIPFAVLFLLVIAFIAPVIEELIFRGLASKLLFPASSKWLAGTVTSALFSLLHTTNIVEFVMYFGLGAIMYIVYMRRGNIKDSICFHILNNLPAAILLAVTFFF